MTASKPGGRAKVPGMKSRKEKGKHKEKKKNLH